MTVSLEIEHLIEVKRLFSERFPNLELVACTIREKTSSGNGKKRYKKNELANAIVNMLKEEDLTANEIAERLNIAYSNVVSSIAKANKIGHLIICNHEKKGLGNSPYSLILRGNENE